MLDVITRALRHPLDYAGIYRITDLKLIEKVDEGNGVWSFIMQGDHLLSWKAGQHAIFTLPRQKVEGKTWRPFSVASASHEGVIRIGTNIPETPSSFKAHLLNLPISGRVRMYGPYGELYLRPQTGEVVAVAGGIGITPFRSIIADLTYKQSPQALTLIYSAKIAHTYRSQLEAWTSSNPNIKIIYVHTSEEVNTELEKLVARKGKHAHYLLSGAPKMIDGLREKLLSLNIQKGLICHDPFKGY
jgi:ferredoxin-NADP reductase